MIRKYDNQDQAIDVAKRALWLAWQAAGGPLGMSVLRDRPEATEQDVWDNTVSRGDYPGTSTNKTEIRADYVFGRMLKLYFNMPEDKGIDVPERETQIDYQGWCGKYPSYSVLFDNAEEQLKHQSPD